MTHRIALTTTLASSLFLSPSWGGAGSPTATHSPILTLRVGESMTISLKKNIRSIAVVDSQVADIVTHNRKKATVLGMRPGKTDIRIRYSSGPAITIHLLVKTGRAIRRKPPRSAAHRISMRPPVFLSQGGTTTLTFRHSIAMAHILDPKIVDVVGIMPRSVKILGKSQGGTIFRIKFKNNNYLVFAVFVGSHANRNARPSSTTSITRVTRQITLASGTLRIGSTKTPVDRVWVQDHKIADAAVAGNKKLLFVGKSAGRSTVTMRLANGRMLRFAVTVTR